MFGIFPSFLSFGAGGIITVKDFLLECAVEHDSCIAFVMGVTEGARHQTRERLKAQPYSFQLHGRPVCLPDSWTSQQLTQIVISVLTKESKFSEYSAVSGVLYALSSRSNCEQT